MAGTGCLTLPWGYQQSGILLGVGLTLIAFGFSSYTCYLVIKTAKSDIDYTMTVERTFGPKGKTFAMFCFIINLYVPILLFQQLLAQSLFPIILAFVSLFTHKTHEIDFKPDWNHFSYTWTCVIILVVTLLMSARRDLKIFIVMNSYGVIFIICIILCMFTIGIYSTLTTEYTFNIDVYNEHFQTSTDYIAYINIVSSSFPPLMGLLGGAFYFHNISLPVIRNSRNPENNVRDIMIGYGLVLITYFLAGALGYFGFTGEIFEASNPMGPNGI